ncbi:MAG TPA: ATP-binding protein [Thermoanaerobaculia bacterium]|nr:ATP-binding protein [Thermoanaerobaculia bacterium]
MPLREKLLHHRKNYRLIFGGLGALLLLFAALFYMAQRGRDLPSALVTNKMLLFVLWYVNVVLILIILFVLLRNLIKLLVERRHRVLGSTFKFKLVLTYVGLSLIPVLLLFAIASELLRGSIDRWFSTPVAPVLERGNAVAQALYDQIGATNVRDASRVLREIHGLDLRQAQQRPRLNRKMGELLPELHLDLLAVYEGRELVNAMVNPQTGIRDLPEPDLSFLEEAAKRGEATTAGGAPGTKGSLLLAAVASPAGSASLPPVPTTEAEREKVRPPVIVIVGKLLDPVLAAQRETLVQDYQAYRQLEVQKDDLRASHMLLFFMVTLLILLASSWTGLYLARRVTVPIQALAEGTRRISSGDLSHRVDVEADDELGVLVDSFNRMTQELESNKELLERSNRELTTSNERLAAERALIAAVLQNVAAGVVSIDSEGRIFTCNGAALDMLRQSEEEVVGRGVDEAWGDRERSRLAAVVHEAGQGAPEETAAKEVHLTLGGEWKTFEVKVTALRDAAGAAQGRVLVIEDLTELIKAQQLAAWNEAARRIAHEIKNPLTPIRLAAERLLRKHRVGDPGLGQAIEEGVEIIVREVVTLQGMVDEFSRYARMPRPRPAPVDLGRLVGETIHLYQNVKPGVDVAAEVDSQLSTVWIDGEQVKRALINLLDNAVEATDAPGRVRVSAHASNGHLEIQVIDTGRGISPAAKEKLFLPYYSTKGRGTGLGLAIVHRIVTDHQGSIRVEDNAPQGTVFTVELPMG